MGIDRNKELYFLIYRVLHWLPIFTSREKIMIQKIHYDGVAHWRHSSVRDYNEIERLW